MRGTSMAFVGPWTLHALEPVPGGYRLYRHGRLLRTNRTYLRGLCGDGGQARHGAVPGPPPSFATAVKIRGGRHVPDLRLGRNPIHDYRQRAARLVQEALRGTYGAGRRGIRK